jgi:hypothetical protein
MLMICRGQSVVASQEDNLIKVWVRYVATGSLEDGRGKTDRVVYSVHIPVEPLISAYWKMGFAMFVGNCAIGGQNMRRESR